VGVTAPTGASGSFSVRGAQTAAASFDNHTMIEGVSAIGGAAWTLGTIGAGNTTPITVEALVVNGGTPGNVTLQWAQGTSSATATRVFARSFLHAIKAP
jgi:hypothetical protein